MMPEKYSGRFLIVPHDFSSFLINSPISLRSFIVHNSAWVDHEKNRTHTDWEINFCLKRAPIIMIRKKISLIFNILTIDVENKWRFACKIKKIYVISYIIKSASTNRK